MAILNYFSISIQNDNNDWRVLISCVFSILKCRPLHRTRNEMRSINIEMIDGNVILIIALLTIDIKSLQIRCYVSDRLMSRNSRVQFSFWIATLYRNNNSFMIMNGIWITYWHRSWREKVQFHFIFTMYFYNKWS